MAIKTLVGFETGNTQECSSTTGTISVQSSIKRSGTYALRTNPTTTAVGAAASEFIGANGSPVGGAAATAYIMFYFYYATAPASGDEEIFAGFDLTPTFKFSIRLNSTGVLKTYDSTNTLMATGTKVLSSATWYRINVKVTNGASTSYEVYIDGNLEMSSTTANLGTSAYGRFWFGKHVNSNGNTVDFYYDDIVIDSSVHPAAGFILGHTVISNGGTMQWTAGTAPSNYTVIAEIPSSDTDYVTSTGTASDLALFRFQTVATVGGSGRVNAAQVSERRRLDTAGTNSAAVVFKSNGTSSTSGTASHTTSISVRMRCLDTDPGTGAKLTLADVDQIEGGAIENNAVAVRMTAVQMSVYYTPISEMPHSRGVLGAGR